MLRKASLLAFGLVLGLVLDACQFDPSSSSSGTTSGDAAVPHLCDGRKDCNKCQECALMGECSAIATTCMNDSACFAIDQCVFNCGADAGCKAQCSDQSPGGAATYHAFQQCMFCDACGSDCAGYLTCN